MGMPRKFLLSLFLFFTLVAGAGALAQEESAPTLSISELAQTTLPSVVDTPLHFRLLQVTVPPGQTAEYAAADGMVFQLSGEQTVTTASRTETLQQGQGMYLEAGELATFQAAAGEAAVFLHFLLVPAAELDRPVEAEPATVTELHQTVEPLPGLEPGPYVFDLTFLEFPAETPQNDPHYRTGGALYYVLSGTGEFTLTAEGLTEPKPEGSVIYEPYGLVHQWGNPGDQPLSIVVANISPQGRPPFEFGTPETGSHHAAGATADLTSVEPTLEQLWQVRELLAEYEDVENAIAAGYEQFGECMSGPQGAQGIHFTRGEFIEEPTLDPMQPEALMYEPREDGSLRLIGAEYLVFQQAWHDAGNEAAPALLGREFVLNTTLLDEPFYALHLWVWQYNPLGLFANWNPLVTCP